MVHVAHRLVGELREKCPKLKWAAILSGIEGHCDAFIARIIIKDDHFDCFISGQNNIEMVLDDPIGDEYPYKVFSTDMSFRIGHVAIDTTLCRALSLDLQINYADPDSMDMLWEFFFNCHDLWEWMNGTDMYRIIERGAGMFDPGPDPLQGNHIR